MKSSASVSRKDSGLPSVGIVGGGCAGLWLAYHLLKKWGIEVHLLDRPSFASFASTSNQSWLQSGAYYLANGCVSVARACQAGYQYLTDYAPSTIKSHTPCYFLFSKAEQRDEFLMSAQKAGIDARPVSLSEVHSASPMTAGSALQHAAKVSDCPIDTHSLLKKLSADVGNLGGKFHFVDSLENLATTQRPGGWELTTKDEKFTCDVLVLACGAYIPKVLSKIAPRLAAELIATRIAVMVIKGSVTNAMLVSPQQSQGVNIVPFNDGDRQGATVVANGADAKTMRPEDFQVNPNEKLELMRRLEWNYPGARHEFGPEAHKRMGFYVCQKIQTATPSASLRGRIIYKPEELPGALAFYPGKFTTAPIAAEECAEATIEVLYRYSGKGVSLSRKHSRKKAREKAPAIAKPKCYAFA